MSYVVLARKWRPKRFTEMVGQEHVLRALTNALDSGRVHHAFLFTGTRGVGKTTVARILAKSLNCEKAGVSSHPCGECAACREIDEGRFVDLIEVDAASRTKVDDTRELLDNVQYAPTRGRYKVYLIDEVHMLSNHSFNALLKTLEEPPPHVKFLLATTDPQKLPVTVLSRCLQFSLKRLPAALIAERMNFIATQEQLPYETAALALLARAAEGSMRDALSLMDQLIAFGGARLTEIDARGMLGTIDRGYVERLVGALARGDGAELLAQVRQMDRDAPDYDRALIDLATLLQRIAMVQIVPDAAAEDEQFEAETLRELSRVVTPEDAQLYYQIAVNARRDLNLAPDPRLGFEMSLLRMLAFRPDAAAQAPHTAPASVPVASTPRVRERPAAAAPVAADADPVVRVAPGAPAAARAATASSAVQPPSTVAVSSTVPAPSAVPVSSTVPAPTAVAVSSTVPAPSAVPVSSTVPAPTAVAVSSTVPAPTAVQVDAANWLQVVAAANLSGMARQLALNCVPAGFVGDVLTLQVDPAAAHNRTKPIDDKLVQGLSKYLGRDIRVNFDGSQAAVHSPVRQKLIVDEDRATRAAAAFDADPAVKGLRERFGADVDLSSVKPTN